MLGTQRVLQYVKQNMSKGGGGRESNNPKLIQKEYSKIILYIVRGKCTEQEWWGGGVQPQGMERGNKRKPELGFL